MSTYECRTCTREVDPDVEPSPGEPRHCADCHTDHMRDLDRQIRDGLQGWGGDAA